MKTICYTILFLLFSAQSYSQKIHFTDPGNFWKIREMYIFGSNTPEDFYFDFWYTTDTVIGSTTYKRMICSDSLSRGYVREDTNMGIVYYYDLAGGFENTLYNYNSIFNDTMIYNINSYYIGDRIFNFDSILINGLYHKRYDLECVSCTPYQFYRRYSEVEGIGSLSGPIFPLSSGACASNAETWNYDLLCFSQNSIPPIVSVLQTWDCTGTLIFTNTNTCWPTSVNNIQLSVNYWQLYPNPFKSEFTIETTPSFVKGELSILFIYDMLGKVAYSTSINTNRANISLNDLNSGMYIVELNFPDGSRQIKKIMKE